MTSRPRRLRVVTGVALAIVMLGGASSCGVINSGRADPVIAASTPGAAERLGCTPEEVAVADGEVVSGYEIEGGEIRARCFGTEDDRLRRSWDALRQVATAQQLSAVSVLAGYESPDSNALALAGPIYGDNQRFVIAVLLDAVDEAPDELTLTMVHELAHVLSQVPEQLDPDVAPGECETFDNGFGCYRPRSYVARWVEVFWPSEYLEALPADGKIDIDGGEDRCAADRSFPDAYAASHPDEDFAESFAAYVLDVPVGPDVAVRMDFFAQYPEFVKMRERAQRSGVAGRVPPFEPCGA